jgi:hypothetical protein
MYHLHGRIGLIKKLELHGLVSRVREHDTDRAVKAFLVLLVYNRMRDVKFMGNRSSVRQSFVSAGSTSM